MKNRLGLIEMIELGLNLIAQDLIYKRHTNQMITNYLNSFKFVSK